MAGLPQFTYFTCICVAGHSSEYYTFVSVFISDHAVEIVYGLFIVKSNNLICWNSICTVVIMMLGRLTIIGVIRQLKPELWPFKIDTS